MAHVHSWQKLSVEDKHVMIRPLDEEDYQIALTFTGEEEDDVTEVLLTRAEVQECFDLLFNR